MIYKQSAICTTFNDLVAEPNMAVYEIESFCLADIGQRNEQQDRVSVLQAGEVLLVVLADGAGGHAQGAEAAQAVLDTAERFFLGDGFDPKTIESGSSMGLEFLNELIQSAHDEVNTLARGGGGSAHSTCILLLVSQTYAVWAHVGDSRLYLFEHGSFKSRTTDHSVIEVLKMRGEVTEEEMRTHPARNRLLSALGGEKQPDIDFDSKQLASGDGFLLASDGTWGNVPLDALQSTISAENLKSGASQLIELAKANGGPRCDNLSIALLRVVSK